MKAAVYARARNQGIELPKRLCFFDLRESSARSPAYWKWPLTSITVSVGRLSEVRPVSRRCAAAGDCSGIGFAELVESVGR
jgi:hypothetical protein